MQRYFAEIIDHKAVLSKEDEHHLRNVVRINIGEKVEIVTKDGSYLCKISSLYPFIVEEVEKIEEKRELENELTIAWSLLKGDHNEWIVMKCTEIGASHFVPFVSDRSILKVKLGEQDNRLVRLRRIAKESAQQCRREAIPDVFDYQSFKDAIKKDYDIKLFAYEGLTGKGKTIPEVLADKKAGQSVILVVGPEGGFTEEEAKAAEENGFQMVSLGRRILRAETAAVYGASLISSWSEEQ